MSQTEHPDIQYLKSDYVGKVIAQGLAELYRERPQFPIDYLSKWLYNYSAQQEALKKHREEKSKRGLILQDLEREKIKAEEVQNEKRIEQENKIREINSFEEFIEKKEYPDELVSEFFPEGLYRMIHNLTAVYVGNYEYQRKPVDLNENDDELAHLALEQPKLLQYIGYVSEDKKINQEAKTWVLPEGKGVTYKLFAESDPSQPPPAGNPDEENEKLPESKYIYVPDVVTEPNMYFFKIPRLGAYLSVPLIVRSYLNAESFDDAITKLEQYKADVEENSKAKLDKQNEFEDRINKAKDAEEDYEEILKEYKEMQWPEVPFPDFVNEKKKYVLCVDTLGKDVEIPEEDIKRIDQLCQSFVNKWEATELRYLREDVERFIAYKKSFEVEEAISNYIEAEERLVGQKIGGFGDLPEDKKAFKESEVRLQSVREQLLNKDVGLMHLLNLAQYRIIKYPRILQNAFYLAGFKKEEINEPGTNVLNWRMVRKELFNQGFIDRLMSYVYVGSKSTNVPVYASINRIQKRVSEISKP
jgi:hypothetical protein